MQITRRGFLGGIVASATMAEAGALAELLSWLRRKPVSVTAPAKGWPRYAEPTGPRMYLSRDGLDWQELKGVAHVGFKVLDLHDLDALGPPFLTPIVPIVLRSAEVTVKGRGFPLFMDPFDVSHFRFVSSDGLKVSGALAIREVSHQLGPESRFSIEGTVIDPKIYDFAPPRSPRPLR